MSGHAQTPVRLCVTNAKGGTGKTTVAINVAGALNQRGHDVLFVDVDPQGNATEGLGHVGAYDAAPPTLFHALVDPDARSNATDLIVDHPEMDLLPSNVDMLRAEHALSVAAVLSRATREDVRMDPAAVAECAPALAPEVVANGSELTVVDDLLSVVEPGYDYVVLDCPPFYGNLTDASIYAARNVLVPALTEATSERAIELLIDQIAALERRAGVTIHTRGVVANRVEATNEDESMIQWLNAVFDGFPVWEVRKRVALQRAFSAGESLFAYDEAVDVTDVFAAIAEDLDEQFDRTEVVA